MKHLLFFAAFYVAAGTPTLQAQDLKAEMQSVAKAFEAANNQGDVEKLNTMYTNEVVMIDAESGGKSTVTRAQIKEQDTKNFSERTDQISIVVEIAEALPDGKARVAGTVTGTWTDKKTGAKTNYAGAYDHVAVKEGGQWKLCQMKFMPK